jgi:hypothetical protein
VLAAKFPELFTAAVRVDVDRVVPWRPVAVETRAAYMERWAGFFFYCLKHPEGCLPFPG